MIIFKFVVYLYLIAPFVSLITILLDNIIIKKQKKYKVKEKTQIKKQIEKCVDWKKEIW